MFRQPVGECPECLVDELAEVSGPAGAGPERDAGAHHADGRGGHHRRIGVGFHIRADARGQPFGDGPLDRAVGAGLEIFVRVRSTRAPQPAWLRATDSGYEVELVAGEEGVSPGQACVFYDAPSGRARVLGGGFIQSASAKVIANKAALLFEAVRG